MKNTMCFQGYLNPEKSLIEFISLTSFLIFPFSFVYFRIQMKKLTNVLYIKFNYKMKGYKLIYVWVWVDFMCNFVYLIIHLIIKFISLMFKQISKTKWVDNFWDIILIVLYIEKHIKLSINVLYWKKNGWRYPGVKIYPTHFNLYQKKKQIKRKIKIAGH